MSNIFERYYRFQSMSFTHYIIIWRIREIERQWEEKERNLCLVYVHTKWYRELNVVVDIEKWRRLDLSWYNMLFKRQKTRQAYRSSQPAMAVGMNRFSCCRRFECRVNRPAKIQQSSLVAPGEGHVWPDNPTRQYTPLKQSNSKE